MAISDISADLRGPEGAREIRRGDVPSIGVVYRWNEPLPQDNAGVESVGEPLQYSSRSRVAVVDFPEAGRATPVLLLVVVVI